jgi:predicted nucleic acid-binding protein
MKEAVLFDAAVAAYALGSDSRFRRPCVAILDAAAADRVRAYASTEMIQELVHHRLRRGMDRGVVAAIGRETSAIFTLLNFDREVLDLSLELIERTAIRGRDAVHAATALAYGIETIVSPDRAFDGIPGITRVDPVEFADTLSR